MQSTSSERAARLLLSALRAEGVGASLEVYKEVGETQGVNEVAIMVIPLSGFDTEANDLIQAFTGSLLAYVSIKAEKGGSVRAGRQVPTGNTGPNRK